ncbi:MAG TPA: hypothetical protein VHF06_04215 [Pseudonocardiaceae bacterium]|jgi:hypothetical protein|nr:hypothetical protein [Pseudonocardiaceae bacterium]
MSTKPTSKLPEWRREDPPGYRLAFAVVNLLRDEGWHPVLKLALLVVVVIAGLVGLAVVLGPWSLVAGVGGAGGTAVARAIRGKLM